MAHTGTSTGTATPIGTQIGPDGQPLTGMAAMLHYINTKMQSDPEYAAQIRSDPNFIGPGFSLQNGQVVYTDPGGSGFTYTEAILIAAGAATAGIAIPAILGAGGAEAATAADVTATATEGGTVAGAGTSFAGAAPSLASTGEATVASTALPTAADVGGVSSTIAGAGSAGGSGASTLSQLAPAIKAAGQGIGAATTAAGQNQLNAGNLAIQANNSNTSGQSAYQNEMMGLHNAEQSQRGTEQTNVARASFLENQKPGPFDTQGLTPLSPNYVSTLNALSNQGATDLGSPPKYGTNSLPTPKPYVPLNPAQYTTPSTLQNVGNYVAPIASTIGALAQYMAEYQSPGAAFGDAFSGTLESAMQRQQQLKRQAMLDQLQQQKEQRETQTHQQELSIRQQQLDMERQRHASDLDERKRLNDSKILADREKVAKDTVAGVDEHLAPGDIVPPSTAKDVRTNAPGMTDTLFKPLPMPSTLPGTSVPVEPAESGNLINRGTTDARLKLAQVPKPVRPTEGRALIFDKNKYIDTATGQPVVGGITAADKIERVPEPKPPSEAAANRESSHVDSVHNTALTRVAKYSAPIESHLTAVDDAMKMMGQMTPEADTLVAPLVIKATISGQGSGFRMTRAEIENVTGGRSGWEDLKAKLMHWDQDPSKALLLTPPQRVQLRALLKESRKTANDRVQKIMNAQDEMNEATSAKDIYRIETKLGRVLNPPDEPSIEVKPKQIRYDANGKPLP